MSYVVDQHSGNALRHYPDIYSVMPPTIQRVVQDLYPVCKTLGDENANIVQLYWMWAISKYTLFSTPEVFESDINAGLRKMVGRALLDEDTSVSKSYLKIVRKTDPHGEWTTSKRQALIWAVNDPGLNKILQHCSSINVGYILVVRGIVEVLGEFFTGSAYVRRLIAEHNDEFDSALMDEEFQKVIAAVKDTLRMARVIRRRDYYKQSVLHAQTVRRFVEIHDRAVDELNDLDVYEEKSGCCENQLFPEPPIPGNDVIIPIETLLELRREGQVMRHCVASYEESIRRGTCYIYRVMAPERATLSINPSTLMIREFKLKRNHRPSNGSWNSAKKWIDDSFNQISNISS